MTTTTFEKSIRYDRQTKDFRAELDGTLIGFYGSYHAAEVALDAVAYDTLTLDASWSTAPEASADDDIKWNNAPEATNDPDPLPTDGPGDPIPGDPGYEYHYAMLDTALTRQDQGRCINCGKRGHYTWQCVEIGDLLFAPEPWKDIALGRELCRMRWVHFRGFVTLITEVHARGHLTSYAASYHAYVASYRPDTDLTIERVLTAWGNMITGAPAPRLMAA